MVHGYYYVYTVSLSDFSLNIIENSSINYIRGFTD